VEKDLQVLNLSEISHRKDQAKSTLEGEKKEVVSKQTLFRARKNVKYQSVGAVCACAFNLISYSRERTKK